MRPLLWKGLLFLSIGFNLAFLTLWAGQALFRKEAPEAAGADAPACGTVPCSLYAEVGATPEQWREIEPRLGRLHLGCDRECADLPSLRAELLDLIAAPEPDREAIRAKQREILERQMKIQELVIDYLLEEKETLSPNQQRALFALIRSRCDCGMEPAAHGGCEDGNRPQAHECPDTKEVKKKPN